MVGFLNSIGNDSKALVLDTCGRRSIIKAVGKIQVLGVPFTRDGEQDEEIGCLMFG